MKLNKLFYSQLFLVAILIFASISYGSYSYSKFKNVEVSGYLNATNLSVGSGTERMSMISNSSQVTFNLTGVSMLKVEGGNFTAPFYLGDGSLLTGITGNTTAQIQLSIWDTITDTKWCKYTSATDRIDCDVEPVVDTNT